MGERTESFERFYQEACQQEPPALRTLLVGWDVLECRGEPDRRILVLGNAQGEKRVLKQVSRQQNARMRAELQALNDASEPGIPRLYDFAEDDRYVYLLREYVEGCNLEEWRLQNSTPSPAQIARIGIQLCNILEHIHRRGIIHRDVKPQNVILAPDGRVFLIDFDISRRYNEGGAHDTEYLGTRDTAAPEQFGYGQTDVRTDLYALGVVLLYLATGRYEISALPAVPRPLRGVVRRCTRFAPDRRFASASNLRRRLEGVLHTSRRRVWVGIIAALVSLCALGGIWFLQSRQPVYPSLITLPADTVVVFQEPLIAQCVRAVLGVSENDPVTFSDLAKVSEIQIYGDFTDGAAHDLRYTDDRVYIGERVIHHGSITSLQDLLLMPNLRVLRLYRQPIDTVNVLAALVRLEELYLDESPNVRSISAIAKLEKLRTLDLSDTAVDDLSALSGCPRLRQINLERIPCKHLEVLSRYPYLEYLNVNEASPQAVTDAVRGKMIDYLWLDYSGLTDITPFVAAEGVQQLHAKHNAIASLAGIEALTTLEYVDVAYNPLADLTPLLALPRLKAVRIDPSLQPLWAAIQPQAQFQVEWEN